LQKRFPVFKQEDDACVESANILKALSFYTKQTCMYCENLTCEEVRTRVTGTVKRWVDSFFPSQQGIYSMKLIESSEPKLVLTTSTSTIDIDLPNYNTPKSVLSSENYNNSEQLWQQKTSHTIQKTQKSKSSITSNIKLKPIDCICVLLCSY
jgi:hypothetical protein